MTRYSLRLRLARLIAPEPIMRDPLSGEDGVFVVIRQDKVVATVKAGRFRMKSSHRLRQFDFGSSLRYRPSESFTRFVGTVVR